MSLRFFVVQNTISKRCYILYSFDFFVFILVEQDKISFKKNEFNLSFVKDKTNTIAAGLPTDDNVNVVNTLVIEFSKLNMNIINDEI